jgi:putative transposase
MPAAVAVTRDDHTVEALRSAATASRDADAARRMLALALVKEGHSRTDAARTCGMDRQTLRDWVHRYNTEGLVGLSDRGPPGRTPRLTPAQEAEVAAWVRRGPELAAHGVIRWRRIDLSREIAAKFGVTLAERTVGKLLRKLNFSRISTRPRHPKSDPEAQAHFKKASPSKPQPRFPSEPRASRSRSGSKMKPVSASKAR